MFPLLYAGAVASGAPEMIPAEVYEAAIGRVAEPAGVELALHDGTPFRLADHRGIPVVLSFWASWCGPCRLELPALSSWAADRPDVRVVAVNVDRKRADAERFLDKVRFDLPVAFDPDAAHLGRFGAISMPTTFLFDRSGELVWQHTGYSQEKGFAALEQALGELR